MTEEETIMELAKKDGFSEIRSAGMFQGRKAYQAGYKSLSSRAKTGIPHLITTDKNGNAYYLTYDETLKFLSSL